MAALNTMTAIKKKMHGMKQLKENAFDKADQLDQKYLEQKAIYEKVKTLIIRLIHQFNSFLTPIYNTTPVFLCSIYPARWGRPRSFIMGYSLCQPINSDLFADICIIFVNFWSAAG